MEDLIEKRKTRFLIKTDANSKMKRKTYFFKNRKVAIFAARQLYIHFIVYISEVKNLLKMFF